MAFMSQLFVIDNKTKIEDVLAAEAKKVGAPISVAGFVRFQLGEGIEKKVDDFAAEVAAASGVAQKPEPVE
jgi:elongation factor Ts